MASRFSTFRLAGHLLGIPVDEVQEVVPTKSITPVPLAPTEIAGLVNLRGRILAAIDLRTRLQLAEGEAPAATMTVVLARERSGFGLVVDSIGDVVEIGTERFEEPPETLRGEVRQMIRGAYALEHELLLELKLDAVLAVGAGDRSRSR